MDFVAMAAAFIATHLQGMAWYSVLFGNMWATALFGKDRHGKPKMPKDMDIKIPMGLTVATLLALVVIFERVVELQKIDCYIEGLSIALCASAFQILWSIPNYAWSGRPLIVYLIDMGYSTVGNMIMISVLIMMKK